MQSCLDKNIVDFDATVNFTITQLLEEDDILEGCLFFRQNHALLHYVESVR